MRTRIWYLRSITDSLPAYRPGAAEFPTTAQAFHERYVPVAVLPEEHGDSEEEIGPLFRAFQGEIWSPNGEANPLIASVGTDHTSMSVGDCVEVAEAFYVAAPQGWVRHEKTFDPAEAYQVEA